MAYFGGLARVSTGNVIQRMPSTGWARLITSTAVPFPGDFSSRRDTEGVRREPVGRLWGSGMISYRPSVPLN